MRQGPYKELFILLCHTNAKNSVLLALSTISEGNFPMTKFGLFQF